MTLRLVPFFPLCFFDLELMEKKKKGSFSFPWTLADLICGLWREPLHQLSVFVTRPVLQISLLLSCSSLYLHYAMSIVSACSSLSTKTMLPWASPLWFFPLPFHHLFLPTPSRDLDLYFCLFSGCSSPVIVRL